MVGEPSGDRLAAAILQRWRARGQHIEAAGIVGEHCRGIGVEVLADLDGLSVMGLWDALGAVRKGRRSEQLIVERAQRRRPALLLTVDAPSLTLRIARRLRAYGVPNVHVVAPQVWAWRPWRARHLADQTDSVLCILPFETPHFAGHVRATYVGHPAQRAALGHAAPHEIALLPGSRPAEVWRHAPVLREVASWLSAREPELRFVTVRAPGAPKLTGVDVEERPTLQHLAGAGAAVVASGTATLELATLGVPQVVIYRTDPLTWAVARKLTTIQHIALPNLLAGQRVVPEHLQHLDPASIGSDVLRVLREARPPPWPDTSAEALDRIVDELEAWSTPHADQISSQ